MHPESPRHLAGRLLRRLLQIAVKSRANLLLGGTVYKAKSTSSYSSIGENLQVVGDHGHLAEMLPSNCGYTRRLWVCILSVATLLDCIFLSFAKRARLCRSAGRQALVLLGSMVPEHKYVIVVVVICFGCLKSPRMHSPLLCSCHSLGQTQRSMDVSWSISLTPADRL